MGKTLLELPIVRPYWVTVFTNRAYGPRETSASSIADAAKHVAESHWTGQIPAWIEVQTMAEEVFRFEVLRDDDGTFMLSDTPSAMPTRELPLGRESPRGLHTMAKRFRANT